MKIYKVIWLPDIVDKLAWKHHLATVEVEQMLANSPRFKFAERGRHRGEDVYVALGQTDEGRYIAVWFIYKPNREALILSGRDMDNKERRTYGKK
ncbi:MAG: BrnT family toxin [Chloroflexi bacterium]|nr:BrnT family toxin [Chloroflexota bacterium]